MHCTLQGVAKAMLATRRGGGGTINLCVLWLTFRSQRSCRCSSLLASHRIALCVTTLQSQLSSPLSSLIPLLPSPPSLHCLPILFPLQTTTTLLYVGDIFFGNFLIALSLICARTRLDNWKMHWAFACQAIDNRLGFKGWGKCGW